MTTLATSSTISSEFSKSKIVCNKEGVVLLKETADNSNIYRIIFNAHNPNFPIHSIVGLKLYTLLYELNRDVIHTFKVVNETETTVETVTLFKPVGRDFGISPKAMHTVSTMHLESGTTCTFNSVDVQPQPHDAIGVNHIPKKYERIQSTHSKLIVYFLSPNDLQFNFTFELSDDEGDKNDDQEEEGVCPIYMENSVALMIKKMFCRLKGFMERMA